MTPFVKSVEYVRWVAERGRARTSRTGAGAVTDRLTVGVGSDAGDMEGAKAGKTGRSLNSTSVDAHRCPELLTLGRDHDPLGFRRSGDARIVSNPPSPR